MVKLSPHPVSVAARSLVAEIVVDGDGWCLIADCEGAVLAAVRALAAARPHRLIENATATIALSDDMRVAELNGTFRHKPGPTNVLSFPAGARAMPPGEPRYLGDVIIARETVLREAEDLGIPPVHHLQHLAIHGVLHLLGYDHITGADAATMEALEIPVLATLGVADPYVSPPLTAPAPNG